MQNGSLQLSSLSLFVCLFIFFIFLVFAGPGICGCFIFFVFTFNQWKLTNLVRHWQHIFLETCDIKFFIEGGIRKQGYTSKDYEEKIVVKAYLRPCATNPFVNRDSSFWNRKFSVNVLLPVLIKIILELLLQGFFEWLMEKTSSGWIQLVQRQTERHQAPSFSFWEVIVLPPFAVLSQPAFNYSKSTIETPEQCVKSVQS